MTFTWNIDDEEGFKEVELIDNGSETMIDNLNKELFVDKV